MNGKSVFLTCTLVIFVNNFEIHVLYFSLSESKYLVNLKLNITTDIYFINVFVVSLSIIVLEEVSA